jgi:hypothetical protein
VLCGTALRQLQVLNTISAQIKTLLGRNKLADSTDDGGSSPEGNSSGKFIKAKTYVAASGSATPAAVSQ